jgi:hypothetical protein
VSPLTVKADKGTFWDRWDALFDVPAFLCFIVWGITFGLGVLVGLAIG